MSLDPMNVIGAVWPSPPPNPQIPHMRCIIADPITDVSLGGSNGAMTDHVGSSGITWWPSELPSSVSISALDRDLGASSWILVQPPWWVVLRNPWGSDGWASPSQKVQGAVAQNNPGGSPQVPPWGVPSYGALHLLRGAGPPIGPPGFRPPSTERVGLRGDHTSSGDAVGILSGPSGVH